MKPTFPVYKLLISSDPDDLTGVTTMSLVEDPAIEVDFIAFSKEQKQNNFLQFSIQNEEKQIVSGPAMIANLPIYRKDVQGNEYYVVADAATIEQVRDKFFENRMNNNVSIEHDGNILPGIFMVESFLIDTARGINTPRGFQTLSNGSWFTSYKVENPEIWAAVKSGEIKGFSIQGMFTYSDAVSTVGMNKVKSIDFFQHLVNDHRKSARKK